MVYKYIQILVFAKIVLLTYPHYIEEGDFVTHDPEKDFSDKGHSSALSFSSDDKSETTPRHEGFQVAYVSTEQEKTVPVDLNIGRPDANADGDSNDPPTKSWLPLEDIQTRRIIDGIKSAYAELRPQIIEMLVEVQSLVDDQHEEDEEEEIGYHNRLHVFKFALQLIVPIVIFVLSTTLFAWFAGNTIASLIAVATSLVFFVSVARVINHSLKAINNDKDHKKFSRWAHVLLILASCILFLAFVVILQLVDVSAYWSIAYLAVSLIVWYFVMRTHYMWSELYLVRDGGVLRAQRPKKGIYFLPTLSRELYLRNVNDCNYAQTWLAEEVGMYRMLISLDAETPDPKEGAEQKEAYINIRYWKNLKFIVDGQQLRSAIRQGSVQRRR